MARVRVEDSDVANLFRPGGTADQLIRRDDTGKSRFNLETGLAFADRTMRSPALGVAGNLAARGVSALVNAARDGQPAQPAAGVPPELQAAAAQKLAQLAPQGQTDAAAATPVADTLESNAVKGPNHAALLWAQRQQDSGQPPNALAMAAQQRLAGMQTPLQAAPVEPNPAGGFGAYTSPFQQPAPRAPSNIGGRINEAKPIGGPGIAHWQDRLERLNKEALTAPRNLQPQIQSEIAITLHNLNQLKGNRAPDKLEEAQLAQTQVERAYRAPTYYSDREQFQREAVPQMIMANTPQGQMPVVKLPDNRVMMRDPQEGGYLIIGRGADGQISHQRITEAQADLLTGDGQPKPQYTPEDQARRKALLQEGIDEALATPAAAPVVSAPSAVTPELLNRKKQVEDRLLQLAQAGGRLSTKDAAEFDDLRQELDLLNQEPTAQTQATPTVAPTQQAAPETAAPTATAPAASATPAEEPVHVFPDTPAAKPVEAKEAPYKPVLPHGSLSREQLLGAAGKANTAEAQAEILSRAQDADVFGTTLEDILTGSHQAKAQFMHELKSAMPAAKSAEEASHLRAQTRLTNAQAAYYENVKPKDVEEDNRLARERAAEAARKNAAGNTLGTQKVDLAKAKQTADVAYKTARAKLGFDTLAEKIRESKRMEELRVGKFGKHTGPVINIGAQQIGAAKGVLDAVKDTTNGVEAKIRDIRSDISKIQFVNPKALEERKPKEPQPPLSGNQLIVMSVEKQKEYNDQRRDASKELKSWERAMDENNKAIQARADKEEELKLYQRELTNPDSELNKAKSYGDMAMEFLVGRLPKGK